MRQSAAVLQVSFPGGGEEGRREGVGGTHQYCGRRVSPKPFNRDPISDQAGFLCSTFRVNYSGDIEKKRTNSL